MKEISNKFSTIKERILYLLECKGIVKDKFFAKIGMTYGNFTGNAKKTPLNSTAIGNILLEIPDVNLEWLITGKGNMLKSEIKENVEDIKKENDIPLIDMNSMSFILDRYESLVAKNTILEKKIEELELSRGTPPDAPTYIISEKKLGSHLAAEPVPSKHTR